MEETAVALKGIRRELTREEAREELRAHGEELGVYAKI